MKITFAFVDGEEQAARTLVRLIDSFLGGVKVHETNTHPPFKHIYLTSKKPQKCCNSNEND